MLCGSARNASSIKVRACHKARVARALNPLSSRRSVIATNSSRMADGCFSKVSSATTSIRLPTWVKWALIGNATAGCGNSWASMFCSKIVFNWVTVLAAQ